MRRSVDALTAIVVIALVLILCAAITMRISVEKQREYYPRAAYITELRAEDDLVFCEDAVGFQWVFYGIEDYDVGDLVILTMDPAGTHETILDDRIVDTMYAGFYR